MQSRLLDRAVLQVTSCCLLLSHVVQPKEQDHNLLCLLLVKADHDVKPACWLCGLKQKMSLYPYMEVFECERRRSLHSDITIRKIGVFLLWANAHMQYYYTPFSDCREFVVCRRNDRAVGLL